MTHLVQQGTSREAEQTAHRLGILPYSRSSFEQVAHVVGEMYVSQHQQIEVQLVESFQIPKGTHSISVSIDRVSMPMEEPRPKPVGRPPKDAPKHPISRVFRMAYCGTVTLHDAKGEAIHTIRYGCMPEGDEQALVMGMADDVMRMLKRRPELKVVLLADGSHENWRLLEAEFDEGTFGRVQLLIDLYHLLEKLGAAAKVLSPHGTEQLMKKWKLRLLNASTGAAEILEELRQSGKEHVREGEEQPVHDAITYLQNHGNRTDYATARRKGLPVGSGNVEATCKSLVEVRMKRPGARWKTDTGEHILHLRALSLSDRWDQAMDITLRPASIRAKVAA
jgi:hypothetical protein